MATPTAQLLSRTLYATDGTTTVWDFAFSGGYLDPSHVKAYTETPLGVRTDIVITEPMLIGEFQLQITPALANGNELVIYRDTPKDVPLVDFTDEAGLSEVALDTNAKQAVFIAAEAIDTVNALDVAAAVAAAEAAGVSADAALAAQLAAEAAASTAAADAAAAANARIDPAVADVEAFILAAEAAIDLDVAAADASAIAADASADAAAASAVAADASADAAAASAVAADASADAAAVSEANAAAVLAGAVAQTSATGSAKLPAGTTSERDGTPQFGWTRANEDTFLLEFYNGSAWVPVGAGATGGVGNPVFYENDKVVTADYTIAGTKNAMSAGPIQIADGVTVTIADGATWSIV